MSGLAGIYHLDGHPVDPVILKRMTDSIAHRGPDGEGQWINGSIGLGHRLLCTTPESLQEQQPMTNEMKTCWIICDGRVDNREELRTALLTKGVRLSTDTDTELILKAYETWGKDCLQKIVGDFAFAIWDERTRTLFCARDPLGIKPFYYYVDGRRFLWGSEIRQIFEDPTICREPNEGMMGEYLIDRITSTEETLYRGILRLPPAHYLVIQNGHLRKGRYFDFDPAKEIRYRSDEEYAEHFYQLFGEAIKCRLRSDRPIGAFLSGGLDSSSIVCMAEKIYRENGFANNGFETFSVMFNEPSCDEQSYIQDVARMCHIRTNYLYPEQNEIVNYTAQILHYQTLPDDPTSFMARSLINLAKQKGIRVLLDGQGGDHCLTGSLYHLADLLSRFKLLKLTRQIQYVPLFLLFAYGIRPLIPYPLRPMLKFLLRPLRPDIPRWVTSHFAKEINLRERLRRKIPQRRFPTLAQQHLYDSFVNGDDIRLRERFDESAASLSVEYRYPFFDLRLVEFSLAIPEEQRCRQDQTKFILRKAMRGILPESIRQRRTKAEFSPPFIHALQRLEVKKLFDSLVLNSLGFVDGRHAREIYQRVCRGGNQSVWPVWMIMGVELWYRIFFISSERR